MRRNSHNGKRRKRRARPGAGGGWYAPRARAPIETPTAAHWLVLRRRRHTRIRAGS